MNADQVEVWGMYIGVTLLILFMGFIVYDLGKRSNAGKFGQVILFLVLGLGVLGFIIKTILVEVIGV